MRDISTPAETPDGRGYLTDVVRRIAAITPGDATALEPLLMAFRRGGGGDRRGRAELP